jgi:plasmid stabilization system protein ParE
MTWRASAEADDDLIAGRDFIAADNERAAQAFLDTAFETFDKLAQFPRMGTLVRLKHPKLKSLRYFVLPPPYNSWLIFYLPSDHGVDIQRVLYGNVNWRDAPGGFF